MANNEDEGWEFDNADGSGFSDAFPTLPELQAMAQDFLKPIQFPRLPTTAEDTLDAVTLSAEHAGKQTALLDALSKASREQAQTLAEMRRLSEELASERRISAAREDIQQGFNRRMSWAALLLAGAAVIVPFGILWIEQALR